TGQLADAEDLVQDTLIRAYRAVHRFDGAHPRAWLMTILRNTAANNHRRWQPALLDDPESPSRTPPEQPGRIRPRRSSWTASSMMQCRALHDLTARQRAVVALVDVDGLSYAEAATRLAIPEGTVMSRLHAARARMRRTLGRTGVVPKRGDVR
ncbi:RNA polymerase sigma factor, partial [Pseudonocardia nigra]|uniref:RNA polymerase sigma factor n=1 Tax=Pseudonocardia nigra TaxID=1921578 RepID=UPI001C600F37